MTLAKQKYAELIALTKQHLIDEFKGAERLPTDGETYHYFRAIAALGAQKKAPAVAHAQPQAQIQKNVQTSPSLVNQAPIAQKTVNLAPQAIKEPSSTIESISTTSPKLESRRQPLPLPKPSLPVGTPQNVKNDSLEKALVFTLETPPPSKPENFDELRKIIDTKLPHFNFIEKIPDDSQAKILSKIWEQKGEVPEVVILTFNESKKDLVFLQNIAKSLSIIGMTTSLLNALNAIKDNTLNDILSSQVLKLVLAGEQGIKSCKEIQSLITWSNDGSRHFIDKKPMLNLNSSENYLREPSLKASLWHAIIESRG